MIKFLRVVLFFFVLIFNNSLLYSWSWLYQKKFSNKELSNLSHEKEYVFTKEGINSFTQLIFGWNAQRPKKGFYSFFVQVRNKFSKKWSSWHKMMEWGAGIQRSFKTDSDGLCYFAHVRLETIKSIQADAFRIKIKSENQASLDYLKNISVTAINFNHFKTELTGKSRHVKKLTSVLVSNVPKISQFLLNHPDNYRICSPTSCTMISRFFSKKNIDPIAFAAGVYDYGLGGYGSWPFNTAHIFEQLNGSFSVYPTRLSSFAHLHQYLLAGIPVVVSVRGKMVSAPKPYRDGHLLVVVGWDNKKKEVICHDPAFGSYDEIAHRYNYFEFLKAWELSRRLTYVVQPIIKKE